MATALVSELLRQLAIIISQEAAQEVKLVVGAKKQVGKLTSNLQAIQAVLEDAEKKQVKVTAVRDWLDKLKQASYDVDDVLDEWNTAIFKLKIEKEAGLVEDSSVLVEKVFSFIPSPCFCFNRVFHRRDIAVKIVELNEKLDMIAIEKERYHFDLTRGSEEPERLITTSFIDVSEVFGRDHDENALVCKLLDESTQPENGLHIITIVGMGGIGKTTLAQLAYNNNEVNAYFDRAIWVCVSDPFDEIRIAKAIIESFTGAIPSAAELQTLLQSMQKCIQGKKFLLVLDDVWTEDYKKWEQLKKVLKYGASGSNILVTTRKEEVARMLGTTKLIPLEELSEQNCWLLFSQVACFGREDNEGKRW